MIALQQIIVRLGMALLFGAVIGIERELRQKYAGLKTMTLVSLGAASFAMMSDTFAHNNNPGQIAAAVVGGIGFIGAGVIMHHDTTIQGVTTAATLWVAASVGVAAGLGHVALATTLTIAVAIVQLAFPSIEKLLHRKGNTSAPPSAPDRE